MVEFKTEVYKNIEITYKVYSDGLFLAKALGIFVSDCNGKGCKTFADAKKGIERKIDSFLETTPKNYEELAKAIESTLVWTGYEDCYVDENIIKTLIENFITYKNN